MYNKEKLLSIGNGVITCLTLIASIFNLVDFGIGMVRKCRKPKTVEGFTAPTNED